MENPPPDFDLKTEIDLIFAIAKAATNTRDFLAERPWLANCGVFASSMPSLTNEDMEEFVSKALIAVVTKASESDAQGN